MAAKLKFNEKKLIQPLLVLAAILVVALSLIGDKGYFQLLALRGQEADLKKEIRALEREKEEWINKVENLKQKGSYLETVARERLGLIAAGELLYLPHLKPPAPPAPAEDQNQKE